MTQHASETYAPSVIIDGAVELYYDNVTTSIYT